MDALQEQIDSGRLSNRQAILRARCLEATRPDCLELQNFIANRLWNEHLKDEAGAVWEAAFNRARALIPAGFKGAIAWNETDNRPFLRTAHGYLLSLMHRREGSSAERLAKKMLTWCNADNLGIRFLLADIQLLKGDRRRALALCLERGDSHPQSWYQAGQLAFKNQDFVNACTYIRRGIAANPYIAEALTGRAMLKEHLYWHSSNIHGPEWACTYLDNLPIPWSDEETDFVDWVLNSSVVLKERAELAEIAEALTYERDPLKRGPAVERSLRFAKSITEASSAALVRPVMNRWGEEIWPWDRAAFMHPQLRSSGSRTP